ncbi:hypothetical protein LX87_05201 [Larkinella arboricola]|uniref:Uncharacterized protein n=1 Tax=Larkinella arboricola TaxID=643671 RepID=A0A327WKD4_LARAB|nr:hypothetical protein [Larkinella arboricola]RAJ92233.1 hypothetical protein LX87_05201 [Larkinella arboricola]
MVAVSNLATVAAAEPTVARTVMLWSWWKSKDGKRQFAVVEKILKGVTSDVRTVGIKLLEVGDSNPFYYALDEFFSLVDKGSMIEMIPEPKAK